MAAAQAGDRVAYRTLLLAVTPYVRAMAARAFRNPADVEDAVQDILLTLHETRALFDPARPFRPWLAGIARHRIADRIRRRSRALARETPLGPEHETFSADVPNREDVSADIPSLHAALGSLPAGQRVAVELLKLQEMSLKQAEGVSGMSVAALKVATHRAIKRLRQLLGHPGEAA
jgi:RNA polymerase sigma-70 factor, ECF subfamily